MKKIISYILKFIIGAVFIPILIVNTLLVTICIIVWTLLIHRDHKEEDLLLEKIGWYLELPSMWMGCLYLRIDQWVGR